MRSPIRVYADTSVFGGVFDQEFSEHSKAFFRLVREGRFLLVVSGLVRGEVVDAPEEVQALFQEIVPLADLVDVNEEVLRLVRGYVDGGVVSRKWRDDATHVAAATVAECSLIVSWNFRHIVHYQKIPRYNAINILHGYSPIAIYSPMEVAANED